ncbi:hypothetical protein PS876_04116 [Pseudomonas fluorescens]|nr:hypothetical protein PS876_04116 [Pseudomonas fluorescens]
MPELGTSVLLIPADFGSRHKRAGVKNGDERLVVLNSVAKSIIDKQRGLNKEWVFSYNGNAMHRMNDSAWKKAGRILREDGDLASRIAVHKDGASVSFFYRNWWEAKQRIRLRVWAAQITDGHPQGTQPSPSAHR